MERPFAARSTGQMPWRVGILLTLEVLPANGHSCFAEEQVASSAQLPSFTSTLVLGHLKVLTTEHQRCLVEMCSQEEVPLRTLCLDLLPANSSASAPGL